MALTAPIAPGMSHHCGAKGVSQHTASFGVVSVPESVLLRLAAKKILSIEGITPVGFSTRPEPFIPALFISRQSWFIPH